MAKGAMSKATIEAKLLEIFEGAFKYDKEIRIPMIEDGTEIQIKITMTCAKTNVEPGGDVAVPGVVKATASASFPEPVQKETVKIEATEEEKAKVLDLMSQLGL